jgi:hypothetical protein
MATFTVSRKTWYRGQGPHESYLLQDDGTRCCIGFVGQQCGISDHALLLRRTARIAAGLEPEPGWPEWLKGTTTSGVYTTNDNVLLSDPERESKLKEIFSAHGDEIVFVD